MGWLSSSVWLAVALAVLAGGARAAVTTAPLRLVTGNLSVDAIQHSPVGASPDPAFRAAVPSLEELRRLRAAGLDAYEDYIAWGMVEPREGEFDFSHHERVCRMIGEAGLAYMPYIWCHVPPAWLRADPRVTLMRCSAHGRSCNMLSIFDPRTIGWYERFYRALHARMGSRTRETYACILGPYGEGNYPLPYADWVLRLGHCHEGFWCGDTHALPAFRDAMRRKYGSVERLNGAWHTQLASFDEVVFPDETTRGSIPSQVRRPPWERRRWLDFIRWYHDALIDFAGRSADMAAGVFGRERIAVKPGGNAGWMNPLSWGTYCPGFAKMAGARAMPVQSADSRGAYWADKWSSTACAFYGCEYRTEAAGQLDAREFMKRAFTDASCGSTRLFTYELDRHLSGSLEVVHLYTGERGRTDIALLAPTTTYYLNGDVMPAVNAGMRLRDFFDYDVLDELLIDDGVLDSRERRGRKGGGAARPRYRVLVALDCAVVEAAVLERIQAWVRAGGTLVWAAGAPVQDVEGNTSWEVNPKPGEKPHADGSLARGKGRLFRVTADSDDVARVVARLDREAGRDGSYLAGHLDGRADGVWITEFGTRLLLLNLGEKPVERAIEWSAIRRHVRLEPMRIVALPR